MSDVTIQPDQGSPPKAKPHLIWWILKYVWDRIPSTWTAWGLSWLAMWWISPVFISLIIAILLLLPGDDLLVWLIWLSVFFAVACILYGFPLLIVIKHLAVSKGAVQRVAVLAILFTCAYVLWHLAMLIKICLEPV